MALVRELKSANASTLKLNGGIFGECQINTFDRRISPWLNIVKNNCQAIELLRKTSIKSENNTWHHWRSHFNHLAGLRYCVNSLSIDFKEEKEEKE